MMRRLWCRIVGHDDQPSYVTLDGVQFRCLRCGRAGPFVKSM